jgi:cold shock protein
LIPHIESRLQRRTLNIGERDAERYCEVVQSSKGFGFIQPDGGGADIFVHISAVERAGLSTLSDGQKVSFEEERDPKKGKNSAVNIKVL